MSEHDVDESHQEPSSNVGGRGIKILGETVVPGASLVLDGKLLPGAAHLVGGLVARWAFGPVGWLLGGQLVFEVGHRPEPEEHLQSTRPEGTRHRYVQG